MSNSGARSLSAGLMALSIAATLAGARPADAARSGQPNVFDKMTEAAATIGDQAVASTRNVQGLQRDVDRSVRLINQVEQSAWCPDSPAEAFVGGFVSGVLQHRLEFHVFTPNGILYFDFQSGTTLVDAIDAIDDEPHYVGVTASVAQGNADRISLQFTEYAVVPYVRVKQYAPAPPAVYTHAVGGVAMFEWLDYRCAVGVPVCAEPGVLYLSSPGDDKQGRTTLIIGGSEQTSQFFTFASGTYIGNIAGSINSMTYFVGVRAEICDENPHRVEVRSTVVGESSRVWIQEVGGVPPIIYTQPVGGIPSYNLSDQGRDRAPGDVDCDRAVGEPDLLQVVQSWGACPPTPTTCPADLDANEVVHVADLLTVIANWGEGD